MSYDEFTSWQAFYLLEPWGWEDREYRTASLLAQMVNVNVAKRKDQKETADYVRDMPKLISQAVLQQKKEVDLREKYLQADPKEKARMIAASFGVKDKK
jgi:hypothetical protein